MSTPYHYKSLDAKLRHIRVLTLLPGTFTEPIKVSLGVLPLGDDELPFEALSYTWGSPLDPIEITIQHESGFGMLSVTQNLFGALTHLRYETEPRVLWIDAICINQYNDQEKSWQVQIMRDIYKTAQNVIVWLGPPAENSHLAFEFFREYGRGKVSLVDGIDALKEDKLNESHGWGDPEQRKHRYRVFAALKALYVRPWWERVWVLQEVALARNLFLICGGDRIDAEIAVAAFRDADKFYRAVTTIDLDENQKWVRQDLRQDLGNASMDSFFRIGRPIAMLEARDQLGKIRLPLEEILIRTRLDYLTMLRATDPRDVIYGVLGLASDVKELGIVPNYGLSYSKVYTTATQALLCNGHFVSLYHAHYDKNIADLPSWVPDWSSVGPSEVSLFEISSKSRDRYQAGGSSQFSPTFLDVDNQKTLMVVKGVVLGSVIRLDKATNYVDFRSEPGDEIGISMVQKVLVWVLKLSDFVNLTLRADFETQDTGQKLWTRLYQIEKTSEPAQALDSDTLQSLTTVWRTLNSGQESTAKLGARGKKQRMTDRGIGGIKRAMKIFGFDDPTGLEHVQLENDDLFSADLVSALISSHNRVPFLTGDKRFGLGPSKLSLGDVVAVLLGIPTPFIVRRVGGGLYSLVGPAYIDGIMFGELVTDENNIKTVILC